MSTEVNAITVYDLSDADSGYYILSTTPSLSAIKPRLFRPFAGDPAGPWCEIDEHGHFRGQLYDYSPTWEALYPREQ